MNDMTYAFSANLEKCYSMEVYVLVGFHISMYWSLIVNITRRLDFTMWYTTRGSRRLIVSYAATYNGDHNAKDA